MPRIRSHGVDADLRVEGSRVSVRRTQANESQVLEDAARKRAMSHRKSDFMRPMASIPTIVMEKLKTTNPDVARGDAKATERWLNTSEGREYRTTPKGASRAFVWMGGSKRGR